MKMLSFQAIIDKRCYESLNEAHYYMCYHRFRQSYKERMKQLSSASNQIFSTQRHSKDTHECVRWRYYNFPTSIQFYKESNETLRHSYRAMFGQKVHGCCNEVFLLFISPPVKKISYNNGEVDHKGPQ